VCGVADCEGVRCLLCVVWLIVWVYSVYCVWLIVMVCSVYCVWLIVRFAVCTVCGVVDCEGMQCVLCVVWLTVHCFEKMFKALLNQSALNSLAKRTSSFPFDSPVWLSQLSSKYSRIALHHADGHDRLFMHCFYVHYIKDA
jgi:hypothetical protein